MVAPDASVAARYVGLLLQMQGATINDVYEARMISEPPCARLLALQRTDEDIEKLTEVVDELKAEVAAKKPFIPDPYTWSRLTYRFHELILEGCGNKTMAIQGAVLQDIVATHLRTKIAQRDDNDTDERFQRVIAPREAHRAGQGGERGRGGEALALPHGGRRPAPAQGRPEDQAGRRPVRLTLHGRTGLGRNERARTARPVLRLAKGGQLER